MTKNSVLTIVTPVYNEAENFQKLYKAIRKKVKTKNKIIVVYDFEEDNTVPIAKKLAKKDKDLILLKNLYGRGALNAVKSGLNSVQVGACLVTMADMSDEMADVDKMYKKYINGAKVVCGSRYMKGGKQIGGPFTKRTLSRLAGVSLYYLRRVPTHDITNNFKLYDSDLLKRIKIESQAGFEIAMEITVKAFSLRAKIEEVPTTWTDRAAGESNFRLWKWLPSYLKWYFYAFKPRKG
jgi:dolichol-phosphate mannosyltransferase